MTFEESQKFFHGETDGPNTFLGKAWRKTHGQNTPISWDAILKAYADETKKDLITLKALVCV